MATLLSVNDPRTHMEAGYEAEPILGEVACHHFCEDRIFMRHLEFLSRMRHSGEIGTLYSQGEISKFCAALLLARAVDKEQLRKAVAVDVEDPLSVAHFGSPLPLRSFLSSFLGEEFASKLKLPPALTRAFVRFVQFVRSEGPITMETLMQAVKHGVALLCKIGEVDVDIIVPLIMLEDGEAPHLRDLQGRHLSMIAIQVKNYHSKPIPVPTMAKILANSFGFAQKILSGIEEDTDEQGHSQEKAPCKEDTGLVSKMEEDISKIAHSEVEPGDTILAPKQPMVTILMDTGTAIQKSFERQCCRDFSAQWTHEISAVAEKWSDAQKEVEELTARNKAIMAKSEAAKKKLQKDLLAAEVKSSSTRALLNTMLEAAEEDNGPCIVVQTLGPHYECVTDEELFILRKLVAPVGDYFEIVDSQARAVGLSEEERRQLLQGMRPVVGVTMGNMVKK